MKMFLISTLMFALAACVSGTPPSMSRKVKIWNGSPEEGGICRMSTDELATKVNAISFVLKSYHQGTHAQECIKSSDERFKLYGSLTFEDIGVLYDYIQALNYKCEKWAK